MAPLPQAAIVLFDVNGAFASAALAWARDLRPDASRVSANGRAIALGHPLGAKDTRLATTLLHKMERRNAHVLKS